MCLGMHLVMYIDMDMRMDLSMDLDIECFDSINTRLPRILENRVLDQMILQSRKARDVL